MDIHRVIDTGRPNELVRPVPKKQERYGICFTASFAGFDFGSKAIAGKIETREYTLSPPGESGGSRLKPESIIQNRLRMDRKVVLKTKDFPLDRGVVAQFRSHLDAGMQGAGWLEERVG